MIKLLVIDNYDSFTYNLVHILEEKEDIGLTVARNDKLRVEDAENYDKILLSPGPGIPDEAGNMKAIIKKYAPSKSILGVCLGHQGIGEIFGAKLVNLDTVYHGVATPVRVLKDDLLFKGVPQEFAGGRYHCWAVSDHELPFELDVLARGGDGEIMAMRHNHFDVRGVQFHPESIMTEYGKEIVFNWLYR